MKQNYCYLLLLFSITHFTFGQVGVGTTTPNGAFEINSSTQGLVMPRVSLTSSNVAAPVVNPNGGAILSGTMIYNTATAGSSPNNVVPGYYFWDGTKWLRVTTQSTASNPDWSIAGNTGTTAGTHFIGTTDAVDFVAKTNNTERLRIKSTGNIGVGTTNPLNYLHLNETGQTTGISTSYVKGQIITATGAGFAGGFSGPGLYLENLTNTAGNKLMKMNYTSNLANKGILNFQAVSDNASATVALVMALTHDGLVGIGTVDPANKLEITHGSAGNSGLRFTNLTAASTATTPAPSNKVLTVNANGDVVLVSYTELNKAAVTANRQTGSSGSTISVGTMAYENYDGNYSNNLVLPASAPYIGFELTIYCGSTFSTTILNTNTDMGASTTITTGNSKHFKWGGGKWQLLN
jgi:hypothetical protein